MSDLFSRMVGRATGGWKSPLEPVLSSRYERSGYGAANESGSWVEGSGRVFGPRGEMTSAGLDGARSGDGGMRREESPARERLRDGEGEPARRHAGHESWADRFGDGTGDLAGEPSEMAEVEITAGAADARSSTRAGVSACMRADFAEDLAAAVKARALFRAKEETAGEVGQEDKSELRRSGEADGDPKSLSPTYIELLQTIGKAANGAARTRAEHRAASIKEAMEARPGSREANEVNVTIGTIEVRLAPAARAPTRKVAAPKVSLDDYLGQRNFQGNFQSKPGSRDRSGR